MVAEWRTFVVGEIKAAAQRGHESNRIETKVDRPVAERVREIRGRELGGFGDTMKKNFGVPTVSISI